jgi:hypothetical protein
MASHPACPRCYSEDDVLRPWAGFRVAKVVWLAGAGLILLLAPILFSDLVVMIPLSMAFLFAGGPVFGFAAQQPICPACGLARPHPGWHETPCRPVRGLQAPPSLHLPPTAPEPDTDEHSGLHTLPRRPSREG